MKEGKVGKGLIMIYKQVREEGRVYEGQEGKEGKEGREEEVVGKGRKGRKGREEEVVGKGRALLWYMRRIQVFNISSQRQRAVQ